MALNSACPFASAKRTILHKLRVATDYSPKGSVDAKITHLISALNALPHYATTSSCSGRVALYCHDGSGGGGGREEEGSAEPGDGGAESAKGCGRWLLVEHGAVTAAAVAAALREAWPGATAVLKVEPFILHVQARDMASAVRLLAVATRAGFRESGIVAGSSGRGKLIVAVRSTAGGMDSPLQWEGQPLVRVHGEGQGAGALDAMFVQLVAAANARMAAVEARRARFEAEFELEFKAEVAAAAAAEAAEAAVAAARSAGSVACAQCSAQFASRNQLFSRHLVQAPGSTRPVCPSPAAPAGAAAAHTCLGCGHSASSRNALFRHVAACTLAPPQRAAAAAGPAGPPEGSTGVDAEAVAARSASRALLQRVREGIAATAAAAAALPLRASDPPLTPLASGLLRRWGHCTMPLPGSPSVLVFGGSCGEGLHGRRNDLLLVHAESGQVWEVACAAGAEAPPPRVRATLVPLTPLSAPASSATPATITTLALLFGGHCGPAAPLGDLWLLRVTQPLPLPSSSACTVTASWVRVPFVDAQGALLPAASAPCARYGHTLCATSEPGTAILFGGRVYGGGLGDCWRLRLTGEQQGVCAVRTGAAAPHPGTRFSHAAATLHSGGSEYMLVHGGFRQPLTALDTRGSQILSDCWALDCAQGVWRELPLPLPAPLPLPFAPVLHISTPPRAALARFSHSLTLVQGGAVQGSAACMLLLLGGECIDPQRVGPLFIHLSSRALPTSEGDTTATTATTTTTSPGLDFSSALCSPGPAALTQLGYGGCVGPAAAAAAFPALNPTPLLLQHTATVVGQSGRVLVVGGGGVCFAFGSTFSPSLLLPSAALPLPPSADAASEEGCGPLISLPPALAQAVKAEVQALGWFDLERKVGPLITTKSSAAAGAAVEAQPLLGVPLTQQGYAQLLQMGQGCSISAPSLAAALAARTAALLPTGRLPLFIQEGLGQAHRNDGGPAAMHRASLAVRQLVSTWATLDHSALDSLCTPGAHPGGMPRRIEWLADVLLLPEAAFTSAAWGGVLGAGSARAAELWGVLGGVFNATRLARGARIDAGGTRASHLTMLLTPPPPRGAYAVPAIGGGSAGGTAECAAAADADAEAASGLPLPPLPPSALASLHTGSGGWVRVKEGGLSYALDATRVMFSSGNGSEKARMGALVCQGQTVVDLYAGIGYFTLPVLVHAGAAHVHAAEWNPDAVACLRVNLALAGVEARCSVWPGDNGALLARAPALLGCADRVLLGLIPSSRGAWGTALRVLKPRGGTLHVHYNVSEDGAAQFAAGDLLPALQRLAAEDSALAAHGWAFALRHCERVKSYAPRVAHFVFDVEVQQQQQN